MALVTFIAKLSDRFRSSASISSDPRHQLGDQGERIAIRFLKRKGFKILCRNYRAPKGGEVDIVCRDRNEGVLVFVEVKTRETARGGRPAEAVNRAKQYLIARGAMAWLTLLDKPEVPFRFDIVEVVMDEPEPVLLKEAFQLPEPFFY